MIQRPTDCFSRTFIILLTKFCGCSKFLLDCLILFDKEIFLAFGVIFFYFFYIIFKELFI